MTCEIIYSNRIMCARFASCDTHGWLGRWRFLRRERRDALTHAQRFASLEGRPVQYTEAVTTAPRPPANWLVAAVSAVATADLALLAMWWVTQ